MKRGREHTTHKNASVARRHKSFLLLDLRSSQSARRSSQLVSLRFIRGCDKSSCWKIRGKVLVNTHERELESGLGTGQIVSDPTTGCHRDESTSSVLRHDRVPSRVRGRRRSGPNRACDSASEETTGEIHDLFLSSLSRAEIMTGCADSHRILAKRVTLGGRNEDEVSQ